MAYITECPHCGIPGVGPCQCVIKFGRRTETRLKAWRLLHGRKPPEGSLKKALGDGRWKDYLSHLSGRAAEVQEERSAKKYVDAALAKMLPKLQDRLDRKFPDNFQVSLKSRISRRFRC